MQIIWTSLQTDNHASTSSLKTQEAHLQQLLSYLNSDGRSFHWCMCSP